MADVVALTGGQGGAATALSGRVVLTPGFLSDAGGGNVGLELRPGLSGVSEGMLTGTDTDLTSFLLSLLSSTLSSIFLFLMPGLAGLMGEGRQEDKEETPSGLTEQKMQGS